MPHYNDYGFANAQAAHTAAYLLPVIQSLAGDLRGKRVLDIGCGNGYVTNWLAEQGAAAAVGVDLSESGILAARIAYPAVRFEIAGADEHVLDNLRERPFDLVVSTEVIEHLYDPRSFLRGCYSACRPGAHFICSTPYHGYLKYLLLAASGKMDSHLTVLWDGGHIKFFSRRTLAKLHEECGFTGCDFRGAGRVPWLWKSMVMRSTRP